MTPGSGDLRKSEYETGFTGKADELSLMNSSKGRQGSRSLWASDGRNSLQKIKSRSKNVNERIW